MPAARNRPNRKAPRVANAPATPSSSIGVLTAIEATGEPIVLIDDLPAPQSARTTVELNAGDLGAEVVVIFERGQPDKPIIIGVLRKAASTRQVKVELDGEKLMLTGDREVTLRCGDASITLTAAGKVLITAAYAS